MLTWGQPGPEDGTSTNQVQHAMGLVFLEGQLPRHHGMEDDPSGNPASSECCPPLSPPMGPAGGTWGTHRLHRSACSPLYFLLMRISGAV